MKTALLFARAYLAGYLIGMLAGCAAPIERYGTTSDGDDFCTIIESRK
jgi:hypothetical protein